MKKLIFLPILMMLLATITSFAGESNCKWDSYFKYPQNGATYQAGSDVYVRVNAKYKQYISYMGLYLNGSYIRKESSSPYEWCKSGSSGDQKLRNMHPGTYKLKAKIKDKCGYQHYIYCTFYVKGNGGHQNHCDFNNPLHDLNWLKKIHQKYSNYTICQYKKNGKVLFKIFKCGVSHYEEYWYDCEGHMICKFMNGHSNSKVSGAHFVKCWYKGCGGGNNGNNNDHCEWKSWYKYPQKNKTYSQGSDVYVRVDTKKYQDIAYMELYVNGQYIRKESSYPYEWCKGNGNSDHKLRNMHKGTYKCRVRIKDKCGKYHEEYTTFYVH